MYLVRVCIPPEQFNEQFVQELQLVHPPLTIENYSRNRINSCFGRNLLGHETFVRQ